MARSTCTRNVAQLVAAISALTAGLAGCTGSGDEPTLAKQADAPESVEIPPVPADGPKLGALADVTPVVDQPKAGAKQIGYLHAGARVTRTKDALGTDGCSGGWYPVRPRGVVCAGTIATTNLEHPTLVAMALQPKLDQPLPYTYARAQKQTALYKRSPSKDNAVVEVAKVNSRAGMAIVGSWSALDPDGKMQRLGMLTNGLFIKAADLKAAKPSKFAGIELDKKTELPVAFVVKRGVRAWDVDGSEATKKKKLKYHEKLTLTGRFRTVAGHQYWAVQDGRYVRHRDVTVVRRRNAFPDFATGEQKWIDVSVITGTAILYEGRRPVFATLVSVGRDRLGDTEQGAVTARGTFHIAGKHITAAKLNPKGLTEYYEIYDLPWAMELSSGQLMHGAFWHNRFGIEHGPGNLQFSPADAARIWQWATPAVPAGWHGVNQPDEARTIVHIRK